MITNSREGGGYPTKQEGEKNEAGKISRLANTSTSRQWSGFRNPRIVRVSRSFGGKDRHSKVCTIRGLRDRRIRLSVPTAIQLYDLQDKLGLNQPSKVIDWLLDASKEDIDKLPPLQMPQGFGQFHQQMLLPHESTSTQSSLNPFFPTSSNFLKDGLNPSFFSSKHGIKINDNVDGGQGESNLPRSRIWDMDVALRSQNKEAERQYLKEKGKMIETNELENNVGISGHHVQVSAQNFFPIVSYSSLPSFPSNNPIPYYNQCEPSNLSLSQLGSHAVQTQLENPLINNAVSYSSSTALPTGSQLYFYPSTTVPSLFPPYLPYVTPTVESDPRHINHFQFLNSGSQHVFSTAPMPPLHLMNSPLKPFQSNANTKSLHLQDTKESEDGGDGDDDDA